MTVPFRHRMPPCRDSLRQIAAIPGQSSLQSITTPLSARCTQWAESLIKKGGTNAALTTPSRAKGARLGDPESRRSTRASLGTASYEFEANSPVWNILPTISVIATEHEPISRFLSISYDFPPPAHRPLTPYSRIFCKQASENQQLADDPRKIFQTNDFNPISFQYFAKSRLQNIENRDFIFLLFSEVFHHGR